jgi:hypothetical protein
MSVAGIAVTIMAGNITPLTVAPYLMAIATPLNDSEARPGGLPDRRNDSIGAADRRAYKAIVHQLAGRRLPLVM